MIARRRSLRVAAGVLVLGTPAHRPPWRRPLPPRPPAPAPGETPALAPPPAPRPAPPRHPAGA
jgi:hypothetical protein